MINPIDLKKASQFFYLTNSNGVQVGTLEVEYRVTLYNDLKNLEINRNYLVEVHSRVRLPNQSPYKITDPNPSSYKDYPVLVQNLVSIESQSQINWNGELKRYAPKTLNSSVSTSNSSNSSKDSGVNSQYTSGASNSQTNSYGTSVSLGFFGDALTGGVSASQEHSSTKSRFNSNSTGSESGSSSGTSASDEFSIKDWGSYASISPADPASLSWVWGQEYPWNAIQYKSSTQGDAIDLPKYMVERIQFGNNLIAPPSQLSLFGLDFKMSAGWLISPVLNTFGAPQSNNVQFTHEIQSVTATHIPSSSDSGLTTTNHALIIQATPGTPPAPGLKSPPPPPANNTSINGPKLDLPLLALDPLEAKSKEGSYAGFMDYSQYIVANQGTEFLLVNNRNDLHVTGTGFTPVSGSNKPLETTNGLLTVKFKITDLDSNYMLILKHWKKDSNPTIPGSVNLVVTINKKTVINKVIDQDEGKGGESNLTGISLRNIEFASIDFHNYLKMGLNEIDIAINSPNNASTYNLQSLAISRD